MVKRFVLCVFVLALILQPVSAIQVEWYQENREVDFIAPNIRHKAVLTIYSDREEFTTVEIRLDVKNGLDYVIEEAQLLLKPGYNKIEVPFIWLAEPVSEDGTPPFENLRGIFVKVSTAYDEPNPDIRLTEQTEIPVSSYYWVGLRMSVNGVIYDPDDYAPVYGGDTVKMWGKLYKDGNPVPNFKIRWIFVIGGQISYSYTDSNGYFEKTTTAPDWSEHDLCSEKGRYYAIQAIDPDGNIVTGWQYTCTYKCEEQLPAGEIIITGLIGYGIAIIGILALLYFWRVFS